eukprot:7106657-Prymnesium_polylepis.1
MSVSSCSLIWASIHFCSRSSGICACRAERGVFSPLATRAICSSSHACESGGANNPGLSGARDDCGARAASVCGGGPAPPWSARWSPARCAGRSSSRAPPPLSRPPSSR